MATTPPTDRLAVCSWSLQPASPDALADALDQIGIHRVQLGLDAVRRGGVWTDGVQRLQDRGVTIASAMFEAVGEDYSTLESIRATGGIVPDTTWPATFEHFQRMASLAERAGLSLVTFHAGFLPDDPHDARTGVVVERLRRVADLLADHGLVGGLETGQEDAATLLAVLRRLEKPNLGVNFDPANMILYGKGDPIQALRVVLPHVVSCHIKDARAAAAPRTWGTEVVVGTGEVDWRAFFGVLSDSTMTGPLAIEREAGENRLADIRAARAFVSPLLETRA